jgi:hypothetical protein
LAGAVVTSELDALGRQIDEKLTRAASVAGASSSFRRGPICADGRRVSLAAWARRLCERQLGADEARAFADDLGDRRVSLRRDAVPDRDILDVTDVALVGALARPSTITELSVRARVPMFRVLAFVQFLSTVDALAIGEDREAPSAPVLPSPRDVASQVLGVPRGASGDLIKSAFRKLARALHPDLHPNACAAERRELERRLAQVNAAYGELIALGSS